MTFAFSNLFVVSSGDRPIHDVTRKLDSFGSLAPGWNYGRGVPAPEHVLSIARTVLSIGSGLGLRADVFPGDFGNVAVAFSARGSAQAASGPTTAASPAGGDFVEVIVGEDGVMELHVERGRGFQFTELERLPNAGYRDVLDRLEALAATDQWNLLESSGPTGLIVTVGGSQTSLSSPHQGASPTRLTGSLAYLSS